MKGQAAGQAFLQQVLSKISDPGLKAQAEAVFANAQVQTEIGGGVAGQAEIDRQLQELRAKETDLTAKATELDTRQAGLETWHGDLNTWAEKHAALVALGKKASDAKWDGKTPAAPPNGEVKLPDNMVTKDDLSAVIAQERSAFLGYDLEKNNIQREHFKTFGALLDVEPLIRHPQIKELGLDGVYQLVHKDALAAKAKEATDKREAEIRADERSKVATLPYAIPTGAGSGSPLDVLTPAGTQPVVDAAVAEYNRLVTARG